MDLDFVSVHKNTERELGPYPAMLTTRLVNNMYVLFALLNIGRKTILKAWVDHRENDVSIVNGACARYMKQILCWESQSAMGIVRILYAGANSFGDPDLKCN